MGGLYSGRWPGDMSGTPGKETTEDYFALDIRAVKRHGLLEPGQEEIPGVAKLEWVSAGFGADKGSALRPWFLCPREGCQKRVAILYAPKDLHGSVTPTNGVFGESTKISWACRTCRNLCYPVELEDREMRALRRLHKSEDRLGDTFLKTQAKPLRMRHETFVRLGKKYLQDRVEFHEAHEEQMLHLRKQMEQETVMFGWLDEPPPSR